MLSIATRVLDDREAAEATRKVDAFRAATATLNSQRVLASVASITYTWSHANCTVLQEEYDRKAAEQCSEMARKVDLVMNSISQREYQRRVAVSSQRARDRRWRHRAWVRILRSLTNERGPWSPFASKADSVAANSSMNSVAPSPAVYVAPKTSTGTAHATQGE